MALPRGRGAVQALVLEAAQAHVVTDDVQHAHHLAEDQHPAPAAAHSATPPHHHHRILCTRMHMCDLYE